MINDRSHTTAYLHQRIINDIQKNIVKLFVGASFSLGNRNTQRKQILSLTKQI